MKAWPFPAIKRELGLLFDIWNFPINSKYTNTQINQYTRILFAAKSFQPSCYSKL